MNPRDTENSPEPVARRAGGSRDLRFWWRRLLRRQAVRGFTLLEAIIAVVVVTVVLQTLTSSVLFMSRGAQAGRQKSRAMAQSNIATQKIVGELRMSSTGLDPMSGAELCRIVNGPGGAELHFRRVVDFGDNGSQLELIWSSLIVLRVDNGSLIRTQDGLNTVLMTRVTDHGFSVDDRGRIRLQVTSSIDENPAEGVVEEEFVVQPLF